ncbi:MAG: hypothetical protein R3312_03480 [Gammaproteobacteria bacterium]|jgi:hypothetical protein|nr:hypothetical protein [Gammaproteobacteria bacterium]
MGFMSLDVINLVGDIVILIDQVSEVGVLVHEVVYFFFVFRQFVIDVMVPA